MNASNRLRSILAALFIVVLAATLIGASVWTPAKEAPVASPVGNTGSPAPVAGTFTGEFDHGIPVYRLPPVAITTTRSAELARMEQEERLARR